MSFVIQLNSAIPDAAAARATRAPQSGAPLECTCIVRQKYERPSALVADRLLVAGENHFHAIP